MKFLIKIDRRTVKKNPDAGSTVSYIREAKSAEFVYKGKELPDYLIEDKNCIVTKINYDKNILHGIITEPLTKKLIKYVLADGKCTISMQQEATKIDHLPEPDHFYKYRKTKVQCDKCKGWFDHNELQSDEFMDSYSDRICPLCNTWDCCQLKYESL